MNMKLPTYPLITVDPFFSIWSKSQKLYESDTILWCDIKKPVRGYLTVDGEVFRFMGAGSESVIEQKSLDVAPYVTTYVFANEKAELTVKFWTPLLLDDLHMLGNICSFIDTDVEIKDGKEHDISIRITADKMLCCGKAKTDVTKETNSYKDISFAKMGKTKQRPLHESGDGVAADWGYIYISGGKAEVSPDGVAVTHSATLSEKVSFSTVMAYDDVYSITYFGDRLKGIWTEKFASAAESIAYCTENREDLFAKLQAQGEKILADAEPFGEAYQKILTASARQVLAAHKLIRDKEGNLLYFSKECHSNGCINTVDVSYPAVPMYLIYNPELVKAMLTGIFRFAHSKMWKYDFAPHDIGRYPIANGQVYALAGGYKIKKPRYFMKFQMPVEECGNMLVMAYAYYKASGDKQFLEEYFATLNKWADYLVMKGVVLDTQLCTDDFAGHSKKNVNLAIKGIMGIACFHRICELLGKDSGYMDKAKAYTEELIGHCRSVGGNGHLPFSLNNGDSWSLKYNMVWDKIFGFGLFDESIYKAESEQYKAVMNKYGVPLDYRKDFTKTDWMIWASCLDETGENTRLVSEAMVRFLEDTPNLVCFSDWYDTKTSKQSGFDHRSVQAGLWMAVLAAKK